MIWGTGPAIHSGALVRTRGTGRAGVGDLDLLKDYPALGVYDLDAAWRYVEAHREEIEQAIRANRDA